MLFQNYMLFPNLTIEQNVAAGLPKGVTAAERAEAIREQMQRFGLLGMEKRYPVQLSGGQAAARGACSHACGAAGDSYAR